MSRSTRHADAGAPFAALAIFGVLAVTPIVAVGALDVCYEPQGAAFFLIGCAIAALSIYPVIAMFVRKPWRLIVALVSGFFGAGIYVCALNEFYTGQSWNIEYYKAIAIFSSIALVPTALSAGVFLVVAHHIFDIPLVIVSFGEGAPSGLLWRLAESYRRKAVGRRSEDLEKEERHIRAETAMEQSLMEKRLLSAKAKYLNSLTEAERATLQLRMEAMARIDARAVIEVERLEAENAELRGMLAAAGIKATL